MNLADVIRRMIEVGTTPEAILIVVETIEALSGTARDMSGTKLDNVRDIQRKYERNRKRKARETVRKNKEIAEANDAAKPPGQKPDTHADMSRTVVEKHCGLTSLPFLPSEVATNKGRKKGEVTRARGTHLPVGAKLSEEDRKFAVDLGVADPDTAWAEFVDYWIGVPGQRGAKLNWSATWRNRVRELVSRKGKSNGRGHRTELQSALDKARQYARSGDPGGQPISEGEPEHRG